MTLCCVIVSHIALADLTRMIKIDRSGKTSLTLRSPKLIMRKLVCNFVFGDVLMHSNHRA